MDKNGQGPGDLDDLWRHVTSALRSQLSDATWNTWFQDVAPVELSDQQFSIAAPSSVAADRIRNSYGGLLTDALRDAGLGELAIDVVVRTRPVDADHPFPDRTEPEHGAGPRTTTLPLDDSDGTRWTAGLNPRYTFDQFVIGTSNRFAHAASLSVAESPARSYNPLFIYGPAGLGKTHLLHAIGHYVNEIHNGKRVRYVSTETLMNEFVDAVRTNTTTIFKRRYREIDVLLIDDIQFLERSPQLQEEFFHTFNSLHGAHSQIVISSDRPPKSIATLEDRLRSRFEWGLITDVQPPEFETRLAILQKKADAEGLHDIPNEVLSFIAENISDNVRELEGALIRVAAYSSVTREPLNEEVARNALADLLPPTRPRVITPELILEETSEMFGFSIDELCGKSRQRPLVTARQIGMYVFRDLTDYSYPKIAEQFGGRDHTTVMHAVDKIKAQMAEKKQILDQVNELMRRIKLGTGG